MIPKYRRIFALYKGENFIADGTISEIAEQTGKSQNFIEYMTYPCYERKCQKNSGKNRLVLVALDD